MRNRLKLLLIVSVSLGLFSGCTQSGTPNPNSGAQTGAVIGGLSGAAIGYNTGHGGGTNAVIGGLLGAAVGAGVGNAVDNSNPPPQNNGGWQ